MTDRHSNQMDALEAELDRALASYTPADAPAGLEQRLSARLAAAAAVPRRPPVMFALGWAWAACAVLVVSVAIVAIHQHRQTRTEAKVQSAPVTRPRPAYAAPVNQAEAVPSVRPARRAAALRPAYRVAPANTTDASLSEMRAPSRPAPPAPLTAEEMLLLRVVQRRDPEQLAMLNPQVRANKAAESDKEFQSFVEQSSTGNE